MMAATTHRPPKDELQGKNDKGKGSVQPIKKPKKS